MMKDGQITILHVFIDGMTFSVVADNYDAMPNVHNLYYFYSPIKGFKLEKIKDSRVRIINNFEEYVSFFSSPDVDVVLFYSLPEFYYYLFDFIDDRKFVIWWGWGYDMYNGQGGNPPLINMELYKPITKAFMLNNKRTPTLPFYKNNFVYKGLSCFKRKAIEFIKNNKQQCYSYSSLPKPKKTQDEILARIDAFYSPLDVEYYFLKKAHPSFKADLFPRPIQNREYQYRNHIQLGNVLVNHSLTYTTNHLDVFEYLYKVYLGADRKFILPVSYGINGYNGNPEILKGVSKFNDNQALWLTKRLPLKEYDEIINSVTHAVFGMLRQQGLGNIFMCLRKGVKIYLFKDSLVYKELKRIGYVCFTIEDDLNSDSLSECLSEQDAKKNYDLHMEMLRSNPPKACFDYLSRVVERQTH